MKRASELQPLSRDHHQALIVARQLRQAAAGLATLPATVEALRIAWRGQIQPHFIEEEELLLPAFAAVAGAEHPLIIRTLGEHAALRIMVWQFLAAEEGRRERAGVLGRMLDAHVRFEERVFFPLIERELSPGALVELGRAIEQSQATRGGSACERS
jgi:hypothetical protein